MILNKKADINNRVEIVRSRVGRAFLRTKMDSIIPPNFETATLALMTFQNNYTSDTTHTKDEIYRLEKDIGIAKRQLRNEYNLLRSYKKSFNKYSVELHKKFSLPVACILFIMTGTSLGVLFKKGGFTIATSLSFGFFLVYYIFMIGGEDLADRTIVSPLVGIWTPNALLFIIAAYLLIHTVREQPPLRISFNIFNRFKKNKDELESTGTA